MTQTINSLAVLWWSAYTVVGIWMQMLVPGVDFLAPGLVLSLQEGGGPVTVLLMLVWVFLQEGMGNLPFGYAIAWYGMLILLYVSGRWLFEARSVSFMCLLGLAMGVLHPLLVDALMSLDSMDSPFHLSMVEGVMQAITFPIVWALAAWLFPKRLKLDDSPFGR